MSAKNLNKRLERIENHSKPTVEEALAWVEREYPPAGQVLREAFERLGGSQRLVNMPPEFKTIEEWLEKKDLMNKPDNN